MSIVSVLTLLPVYHRFPDAFLLVLPMAWAVGTLGTKDDKLGRVALVLLLPFLSQVPDYLGRLGAHFPCSS